MDQISNVEVSESFEYYLSVLKNHLSYVEDTSFRWSDVNGILIIQLKNTDKSAFWLLLDTSRNK